ncbi:hypothetical protein [Rhodococcoides kyotonense]|uniref:Integral membrane protein n=1 Tax=Rhodococcoides kyotonense TaxID=398843 RepID=A0A239ERY7_9NOCA|nr:hypothetical protein [Rhodococcus kyotonensis]SNS47405.1 hypothetical protein SAMN05421642_102535 [Rhodococcus kyotonensis]
MPDTAPQRVRFPRTLRQVDPARRGVVLAWLAFTLTFGGARLVTWLIQIDTSNVGDVSAGGVHLHHYLWGILLLAAVAVFGLVDRSPKARSWMGIALGIALGLIVDEAALLITLQDVYWHSEGWSSIAIAISVIAVGGTALVLTRSGAEKP